VLDQVKPANSVFPPQKILIYGVQGIGKNTLAATFKAPILLQIEDGSAAIDIRGDDLFELIVHIPVAVLLRLFDHALDLRKKHQAVEVGPVRQLTTGGGGRGSVGGEYRKRVWSGAGFSRSWK